MIVCICNGISDREVRAAAEAGAQTLSDLASRCNAGTDCGSCRLALTDIVRDCNGSAPSGSLGPGAAPLNARQHNE